MRIFAVSDLHTDFAENRRRLQQVSSTAYLQDALREGHSKEPLKQIWESVS
jgi:hypothetical protein